MKTRQLTLRVDIELFEMIEGRARANRRSINQEIAVLLEDQIDQVSGRDLELLNKMQDPSPSGSQ